MKDRLARRRLRQWREQEALDIAEIYQRSTLAERATVKRFSHLTEDLTDIQRDTLLNLLLASNDETLEVEFSDDLMVLREPLRNMLSRHRSLGVKV
jgi:glutamine synthetase adenylyltransferase